MEPLELPELGTGDWLQECVRALENGSYGRLVLQVAGKEGRGGRCRGQFFGADGWHSEVSYRDGVVTLGALRLLTSSVLEDPQYEGNMFEQPWCRADDAPGLLQTLDGAQFELWLDQSAADASSIWGFSRAWETLTEAERAGHLSALEFEIEAEVCRVMRWALWSEPSLRHAVDAQDNEYIRDCLWRRPRFIARPEPLFGHFFYDASWWTWGSPNYSQFLLGNDEEEDEDAIVTEHRPDAEARLRAIWSHVERAFAPQIAQLKTRDELHPSVAHWCHFRGAYIVQPETPTAHEKLESHVALSDWLRQNAGVELSDIERDLEAR